VSIRRTIRTVGSQEIRGLLETKTRRLDIAQEGGEEELKKTTIMKEKERQNEQAVFITLSTSAALFGPTSRKEAQKGKIWAATASRIERKWGDALRGDPGVTSAGVITGEIVPDKTRSKKKKAQEAKTNRTKLFVTNSSWENRVPIPD